MAEREVRAFFPRLCAIIIVKDRNHSLSFSNTSSRDLFTALPSTLSFNSPSNRTVSSARDLPMLSEPSRKKLFPASSGLTVDGSRMVKWPMPGNTRFFKMEAEVALPDITRMRDDSSALWPDAAQSLVYLFQSRVLCWQKKVKAP